MNSISYDAVNTMTDPNFMATRHEAILMKEVVSISDPIKRTWLTQTAEKDSTSTSLTNTPVVAKKAAVEIPMATKTTALRAMKVIMIYKR